MPREIVSPAECPVCGESIPRGARSCPGCGADEQSGWDEEATRYDGLGLPDEAFADAREPARVQRKAGGILWLVVTVLLLLAMIITFVLRG